jgi:glycerol-3-phosphate acyltransferase PlsY
VVVTALVVVGAYLLGSFPTAAIVGRRTGFDPERAGSGNPGASNSFRLGGARAGALVLLGDAGKGALAAAAGWAAGGRVGGFAAGAAAVLGHVAPINRPAHGGKGVATATGMVAVLLPFVALAGVATWVIVIAVTRTAGVASITMAAAFVAGTTVGGRPWWEVATVAAVGALIVLRHRDNLSRLRRGEEQILMTRTKPTKETP